MWIEQIFLLFFGLSCGFAVAGGLFALIVGLGIIPRFADKTHTANRILWYEDCILAGGLFGNLISMYHLSVPIGKLGCGFVGIFVGIYVGCLAMALAEIINTFPIFMRRIRISKGIEFIVLSMALGKLLGAVIHFYNGW